MILFPTPICAGEVLWKLVVCYHIDEVPPGNHSLRISLLSSIRNRPVAQNCIPNSQLRKPTSKCILRCQSIPIILPYHHTDSAVQGQVRGNTNLTVLGNSILRALDRPPAVFPGKGVVRPYSQCKRTEGMVGFLILDFQKHLSFTRPDHKFVR